MRHPNVILAVLGAAAALRAQQEALDRVTATFEQRCLECHDSAAKKGGLDLEALASGPKIEWLSALSRVRDQVRAGVMPPKDAEPLTAIEHRELLAGTAAILAHEVPKLPLAAGRVTVRRLSRAEWEYAVFDLFGVLIERTRDFPQDDLGYGFDNIGDALSFSTLHLESYLAAASEVAAQVFHGEDSKAPARRQLEAESMTAQDGAQFGAEGDVANLFTNAAITGEVDLPRDGNYRIGALAGSMPAGDEPARMAISIDGRELCVIDVPQRELRLETVTVPIGRGRHHVAVAFVNDFWDPNHADAARRDRNLLVDWVAVEGPLDQRPTPVQQQWLAPHLAADWPAIAKVIQERVHRHEPSVQQVQNAVEVATRAVAAGSSRDEALRQVLTAALVSPRFLFRLELPGQSANSTTAGSEPIPGSALAVRLSFFLWSSVPDEELAGLGRSGELHDPSVLQRQLARLLEDPRAERMSQNFAAQWLELRALSVRTPDPAMFPGFDETLRRSMRRETELLFWTVLRSGLDVRTLLDCDFTHVDATLARFYGLDGEFGAEFVRVPLQGALQRRRGLLGHASVHAVTSNPTRTSPVKRGKWILENLLDQAPPPPPPGNAIFADEASVRAPRVLREQLAAHRARAACASCHERMDALGLCLERFDAIGRVRDQFGGEPIDSKATLPDGTEIDGEDGLRALLGSDPSLPRTLLRKLFVYGIGREPSPSERLALDLAVDQKAERGIVTIGDLLAMVVTSRAFTHREGNR
ncbi:MAG: DUF1592 domain-containing protein [Planctomycetota bacterium]